MTGPGIARFFRALDEEDLGFVCFRGRSEDDGNGRLAGGFSDAELLGLVAGEAVAVTAIAIVGGVGFLYSLLLIAQPIIQSKMGLFLEVSAFSASETLLLSIVLAIGLVVGLLPAWRCYRSSLSDGLTVKI